MGKCDGQNQYSLKKLGEGLKQMTVTGPGRSKLEQVKNSWLARLFSDLHQALKGEHLAKF